MTNISTDSENSSVLSTDYLSYPEQVSYPDAPGVPLEFNVIDLTPPKPGDSYSKALSLPAQLSLDTSVKIQRGAGMARTLTLGELVREAAHNPQALDEVLRIAYTRGLEPSANVSYLVNGDRPEALISALAQLSSSDPLAREAGAASITEFLLTTRDENLQRGLLTAIDGIVTPEAKTVLTEVYRRSKDPAVQKRMEKLSTHGLYLRHQGQLANSLEKAATSSSKELTPAVSTRVLHFTPSAGAVPSPTVIAKLSYAIAVALQMPAAQALGFSPSQAGGIAKRLVEVSANSAVEQWSATFRAVFMNFGWNSPAFTLDQFGSLAKVAQSVVRASLETLAPSAASSAFPYPLFSPLESSNRSGDALSLATAEKSPDAQEWNVRGFLASLIESASRGGAETAQDNVPPPSTLANAGLQGALGSLSWISGPGAGFRGELGGITRSHYYIEASSDTDGNPQQGSDGQGASHSGQNQDESSKQDSPAPSYSFQIH